MAKTIISGALLNKLEKGKADIRDLPHLHDSEKGHAASLNWPANQKLYCHLYPRSAGRGDLLVPFREMILCGKQVPIDVDLITYQHVPASERKLYEDRFTIPADQSSWRRLQYQVRNRLPSLIDHLNGIYAAPTNGKLQFTLRSITESTMEDSFDASVEHNTKAYCVGFTDSLSVRIHPLSYPWIEEGDFIDTDGGPQGGIYHGRGIIHYSSTCALSPLDITLAHEVGHGLFGFDHHEKRGCIMDGSDISGELKEGVSFALGYAPALPRNILAGPGFKQQKSYPTFCSEDRELLSTI